MMSRGLAGFGIGTAAIVAITPAVGYARDVDVETAAHGDVPVGYTPDTELQPGGTMRITIGASGGTPFTEASSDQWYYWTSAWQDNEKKALKELQEHNYVEFDNVDDALAWLNEPEG